MVHIVMLLDESGSMASIKHDIIKSVNDFINEQKTIKDPNCTFTFVSFSDTVRTMSLKTPLHRTFPLTVENYNPTGSTALYKAIIDTINLFEHDSNVLMVIVTDGQENASPREYS